jgi:hypothetical protein
MKAASEMNAYEFTFDYRGLRAKTFGYILSHPKLLLSDLNSLAKDSGKHSVSFVWIVIFIFAELFAYRLVLMRIEVVGDKGKRLVYVAPAAKKSKNKGKGNDNAKDKPAENSDSVNSD